FYGADGEEGQNQLPHGMLRVLLFLMPIINAITTAESLRLLLGSLTRRKEGSLLVGLGYLGWLGSFLCVGIVAILVRYTKYITFDWYSRIVALAPHIGLGLFVVFTALHLARNIWRTHNELQTAKVQLETSNRRLAAAKAEAEQEKARADEANRAKS